MWIKRAAGAVAVFALALCSLPFAHAQTVPVIFATGSLGGLNANVNVQLAGENTCRINTTNSSPFTGIIQIQLQSLGDTTSGPNSNGFYQQTIYNDSNVPQTTIATGGIIGNWTVYVKSSGTLQAIATTWTNGSVTVNINCTPGNGPPPPVDSSGYQYVDVSNTFPTPIPYTSASPMPVVFPTPFALSYTNASPLPVSTPSSSPLPTASAGYGLPASVPISFAYAGCVNPVGGTPNVTAGNGIEMQCNANGNPIVVFPSAQPINVSNWAAAGFPTPIPWTTASPEPVTTPSATAWPSAGQSEPNPLNNPSVNAFGICYFSTGALNFISNTGVALQCDSKGRLMVTTPAPLATVSPGQAPAVGLCTNAAGCLPPNGDTQFYQAATTTLTQVIAAPGSGSIRITSLVASGLESATGGWIELEYGTGTNCATGTTVLAFVLWVPAAAPGAQISLGTGYGNVFLVPATKALCVIVSAGTVTQASIAGTYTVY
jgi:hypothetical protein